jgi:hypothetical protein
MDLTALNLHHIKKVRVCMAKVSGRIDNDTK